MVIQSTTNLLQQGCHWQEMWVTFLTMATPLRQICGVPVGRGAKAPR